MRTPNYFGGSLLNLVAELEHRLTGEAHHARLHPDIAATIPKASTYVLVLFDGLGDEQLEHPAAGPLLADRVGALDAPFPTTTTVSLATIATGMSPAEHGLLGYQLWLPQEELVVNTIKWTTLWGEPVAWDYRAFLPAPNLWERLRNGGVEPITIQPHGFEDSPLSMTLYRGARFEPWADEAEAVRASLQLASGPDRLVFLYIPHVDFAAHTAGQADQTYSAALGIVARIWEGLATRLPADVSVIGTADHGHIDVLKQGQFSVPRALHEGRDFYGDARALFVRGALAGLEELPGTVFARSEMEDWWGPGERHPEFAERAPDAVVLADPERSLLHKHADDRLIGQHGGLTAAELRIPLLVG